MKQLHQRNLFCWSLFNEERNIDFHSYLWVRPAGNVVTDPLPLTEHDARHLASLGPVSHILLTNSDHVRHAGLLAQQTGALVWGPQGEQGAFPLACSRWLGEGEPLPGLQVFALEGSKTPGELAFLIEGHTLITGDLIRSHAGGRLCLLPDGKLSDKPRAIASVARLAAIASVAAVLPGDGWPVFQGGQAALAELVAALA